MDGLRGRMAKLQAQRLSEQHGCSVSQVYAITADLRPCRKQRADKGKRKANLDHPVLRYAAERVVTRNYDPELALMEAEHNIGPVPVSLGTFRRLLREHGISAADNARNVTPHRNFAYPPGVLYQLDLSAVKTRWLDIRTRNILRLDITPNHPNVNPNYLPIWKIGLIDDGSRYRYVDFIAVPKPTSDDVVDFILAAFREMGIPRMLYSDNDAIIKGGRMKRAAAILNEAFKDSGGFELTQHLPYNAKATGKIEATHRIIEKFEKLIGGLYAQPTLENLKLFTRRVCHHLNWREHRTTGEKPALRFRLAEGVKRVPPSELLDAAFKAKEFHNKPINANVTITIEGAHYQLPRSSDYPFVNLAGQKRIRVKVIWPPDVDWFGIITPDGGEYTIKRKLWQEDDGGEFKSLPETKRQRTKKSLTQSEAERRKAYKESGTQPEVPFFHFTPASESMPILPRQEEAISPAQLADLAPAAIAPTPHEEAVEAYLASYDRLIDYFSAVQLLQEEGCLSSPLNEPDKQWIKYVYEGRNEIPVEELRAAQKARASAPEVFEKLMRA